jgi:hypothetical protein
MNSNTALGIVLPAAQVWRRIGEAISASFSNLMLESSARPLVWPPAVDLQVCVDCHDASVVVMGHRGRVNFTATYQRSTVD